MIDFFEVFIGFNLFMGACVAWGYVVYRMVR